MSSPIESGEPQHVGHADLATENVNYAGTFDLDWEALTFRTPKITSDDWLAAEDWEERFTRDTTGYVADSLTTSFTDLDLSAAQTELRHTPEWADLDSWSGD